MNGSRGGVRGLEECPDYAASTTVALVYLCRYAERSAPLRCFIEAYAARPAGVEHELYVIFKGFPDGRTRAAAEEIIGEIAHSACELPDVGFDLGSYLACAEQVQQDRICFLNSFSRPLVDGWLARLDGALCTPGMGLVGATGSWESFFSASFPQGRLKVRHARTLGRFIELKRAYSPFPNPHVRTNAFMIRRDLLLQLGLHVPETKEEAHRLESGRQSITRRVIAHGFDVAIVGRDGSAIPPARWCDAALFSNGEQRDLLVADNQTVDYELAEPERQAALRHLRWGIQVERAQARQQSLTSPSACGPGLRPGPDSDAWTVVGEQAELDLPVPRRSARHYHLSLTASSQGYAPVNVWLVDQLVGGTEFRYDLGRIGSLPREIRYVGKLRRPTRRLMLAFSNVLGARIALTCTPLLATGSGRLLRIVLPAVSACGAPGVPTRWRCSTARTAVLWWFSRKARTRAIGRYNRFALAAPLPSADTMRAPAASASGSAAMMIGVFASAEGASCDDIAAWRELARRFVRDHPVFLTAPSATAAPLNEGADETGELHLIDGATGAGVRQAELGAIFASGLEYVVVADCRHVPDPRLFQAIEEYVRAHGVFDCLYTDEDIIRPDDSRTSPLFKPAWSPTLAACRDYVGGAVVHRVEALRTLGSADLAGYNLRSADAFLAQWRRGGRIAHIPDILVHRLEGAERTDEPVVTRTRVCARRPASGREANVSIVIPTAGRHGMVRGRSIDLVTNCVSSILSDHHDRPSQIIVVHDDALSPDVMTELRDRGVELLEISRYETVNLAWKMNIGAARARGDLLLFLNDDVEIISADWLSRLAARAQDGVGVVGALLFYEDGAIQHAGAFVRGGTVDHVYRGVSPSGEGYLGWFGCARECTAVTGACMMLPRSVFASLGGFDEHFRIEFNDIDLCLRARQQGLRVILEPNARLFHFEGRSRDVRDVDRKEVRLFWRRWGRHYVEDPFYPSAFAGAVPETENM